MLALYKEVISFLTAETPLFSQITNNLNIRPTSLIALALSIVYILTYRLHLTSSLNIEIVRDISPKTSLLFATLICDLHTF
jgi:hypothetical protein